MNPENLNNKENIDVMEPQVEISEQDISNAKIETPAVKTEIETQKKGLFDKIKNAFKPKLTLEQAKKDNIDMTSIFSMGAGSPQQAGRISEQMGVVNKKWGLGEAGEAAIKKAKEAAEKLAKAKEAGATNEQLTALNAEQIDAINQFKKMVMEKAQELNK